MRRHSLSLFSDIPLFNAARRRGAKVVPQSENKYTGGWRAPFKRKWAQFRKDECDSRDNESGEAQGGGEEEPLGALWRKNEI